MKLSWLALLLFTVVGIAAAQSYPNQPIRLIVPFSPGGGVDTMARIIATPLGERLGQSVVVDNRGGAGGNLGTEIAAHAKPDGYTLLMGSISPNAVNIHLYSRLGFDPVKDFEPIIYVSSIPNVLVVPASSPAKTAREFVELARSRPGKLNYGSAGVGTSQHLAAMLLANSAKLDVVHVPYKGAGQAQADLLGGTLDFMLDTTGALQHVQSGKMRALAIATKKRSPILPDVPTFDEAGIPDVYFGAWYGVLAPAGTPKEIITRLNTELNAILRDPATRKRFLDLGAEVGGGTTEEFATFMAAETARFGPLLKNAGIKLD